MLGYICFGIFFDTVSLINLQLINKSIKAANRHKKKNKTIQVFDLNGNLPRYYK